MFSEQQLAVVRSCSQEGKRLRTCPEAVAVMIENHHRAAFSETLLKVVRFCAEECVRQHTDADAVAWMVEA